MMMVTQAMKMAKAAVAVVVVWHMAELVMEAAVCHHLEFCWRL